MLTAIIFSFLNASGRNCSILRENGLVVEVLAWDYDGIDNNL
jgi:hypothetical protein